MMLVILGADRAPPRRRVCKIGRQEIFASAALERDSGGRDAAITGLPPAEMGPNGWQERCRA